MILNTAECEAGNTKSCPAGNKVTLPSAGEYGDPVDTLGKRAKEGGTVGRKYSSSPDENDDMVG